ncbi:zinc-dependent alcohol dehydrogenase family protein [Bradyrhizobium brasilense]|uniref:NADPH:quinone reductase n=1 Tax=Bradyrhizobium brasilense TaxID=1419277 RepID=A0A1G7JJK5_9BRAD|nr:NAD(P)-dependent alcohol dehydrogenase [Bradyrhizobium brasilense]MCC8971721.1 NAD(P)-dependent alcohol dehydrogenase [Bradyrhizobium brasilense]SDF25137.1 NADPH:quinone reductase [Bradyrhizobium brasilense]
MQAFSIEQPGNPNSLFLKRRTSITPGAREVLVRIRANSLNYRDLLILRGDTFNVRPGLIPLSDGTGDIVAVGDRVTRAKIGDRIAATFFPRWIGGRVRPEYISEQRGSDVDGLLCSHAVISEEEIVHLPAHLSFAEAATLPCAALTAWSALTGPVPVIAGDTVLIQGSGGVSLFALQFAKLFGARVIATTSSADKAERLKELGADDVINYKDTPDWEFAVRKRTGGLGADHIVEVGGLGTLTRSLKASAVGGQIALIGRLTKVEDFDPSALSQSVSTVRRITVGSRDGFDAMNRAIAAQQLRPVISRSFPYSKAMDAFRAFESRSHVGKIVIEHE